MKRDDRVYEREQSAGCVLLHRFDEQWHALLIRVRSRGYELPKGHLERGESWQQAAARELSEETGLISPVDVGALLGEVRYSFGRAPFVHHKTVRYFAAFCDDTILKFGRAELPTRALRWVQHGEIDTLPLVSENLREIVQRAFEQADTTE